MSAILQTLFLVIVSFQIAGQQAETQASGEESSQVTVVDSHGNVVPHRAQQYLDIDWALGTQNGYTIEDILHRICNADHTLHIHDETVLEHVRRALAAAKAACTAIPQTPPPVPAQHSTVGNNGLEYLRSMVSALLVPKTRKLQQTLVIVPGNPLDRTFSGFASDFDILALLTVALNFQQDNIGRNNTANAALARTFKGGRFPAGVNFAVTNTFGAKTKNVMDFTTKSTRQAALADAASDARSIAFPIVGDVEVVQGVITSAISQTRIQDEVKPPKPRQNQTVPRIPLDPKAIPAFVVNFTNLTQPFIKSTCELGGAPPCPQNTRLENLGTVLDKFGNVTPAVEFQGLKPGHIQWPGLDAGAVTTTLQPLESEIQFNPVAVTLTPLKYRGFGNYSVVGDRSSYHMYTPPEKFTTALEVLDYMYYNDAYSYEPFEGGDIISNPLHWREHWHHDIVEPYFYVDYGAEDSTADNTNDTSFSMQMRTGIDNKNKSYGDYTIPEPSVVPTNPSEIFLSSSLDYGRAGQYAYFYTNYFRFLYAYYFGPQVIPATSLSRQRSTSYVKRDKRAAAAGAVQSEATGTEVAAVANSISVSTSNSITQSLNISDIFGNSTFTGPPNLLTRYGGAQLSAVAFGRSYYYTQPSVALVDASSQSTNDAAYPAGAAGSFMAYASGSQFAGVRGQGLASTGEANLDWDVGG